MATIAVPGSSVGCAGVDPDSALRYVARQPILDLQGKVYGYELLFRSGAETVFSGDGEFATRTMIDNTVLFGLEKLTGSLPAFVNCTADALVREQVGLLPPGMTVLEILETVEPVPEVIQACRHLKSLGFRLALDDFVWKPSLEPLIRIVDYIKFDFILSGERERRAMLARLKGVPAVLLAEKVETQQDYQRASAEGFMLFQGYYFCRPTLLTRRKVPANQISHIEMLRLLQQTPLDLPRASEAVKRDAALTYRLLRLVNSPACAMRQEVRSISAALMALGEDVFRRIATLAIASELNSGQPAEILRMAFVRARFCELAAAACGLNTLEQYLMGMFSMRPAMLRAPMEEILTALPLREEIRSALLGEPNSERTLLAWLEANEQGNWQTCDAVALVQRLNSEYLHRSFTDALVWAELSLSGAITKPEDAPPTHPA
jgi:EAL and modified HD-GYP domain-containing signal transduction protein